MGHKQINEVGFKRSTNTIFEFFKKSYSVYQTKIPFLKFNKLSIMKIDHSIKDAECMEDSSSTKRISANIVEIKMDTTSKRINNIEINNIIKN